MNFNLEKNLKIINEIVTYFKRLGNTNIHIDFNSTATSSLFCISGDIKGISDDKLIELDKLLNTPRQQEVEEYYWQLNGQSSIDCELTLVGMMIDSGTINYNNGILTIKLTRNENY